MKEQEELKTIWQNFLDSKKSAGEPDRELQKRLVEHYYPLVRKVANRVHQKLVEVQPDELTSMGIDGLYDAVKGFDPTRFTKFETYAMHRIRGSMLDAVRKADWVPRLVRSNAHKLDRARQLAESEAGRKLSAAEISEKMGISQEEYDDFYRSAATPAVHSVNDASWNSNDNERTFAVDSVEDDTVSQPLNSMLRHEIFAKLMGSNCSEIERKIIKLYYYEGYSMKEISEMVGLSESRVSQMHSTILKRLKNKADRNPVFFSDIFPLLSKICS